MVFQRNRTKSSSSSSHDDRADDKQYKHYYQFLLLRCLPLLLLMIFTAASMLRLLYFVEEEEARDHSGIRTHIPSTKHHLKAHQEAAAASTPTCSALIDGTSRETLDDGRAVLCCDRSHHRTDVCYMRGDIRTDPSTSSISVYGPVPEGLRNSTSGPPETERIRPYTRKWETGVMDTIDELTLRAVPSGDASACEVDHGGVPGVVLSTGGYTGNVYHEFNDGLIPLYITTRRFEGEVVLVVLEYHSWWVTKYGGVIEKMSNYKLVDFAKDRRVHCFSELIVGLKIHGELTIDPQLMPQGSKVGIHDFQAVVNQGFGNSMQLQLQPSHKTSKMAKPKMAIFIRNKSRVILNLREVVRACQRAGFQIQILNPKRTTPLSEIHAALSSSQAMLAVHGAAVTHFLFMRPGSVLLQIVPLGLDWAADAYYGEPARKLGLEYMEYKVGKHESSLSEEYDSHDPVLVNPSAITSKGWDETKKIYLEKQNVRLNIKRFSKVLSRAHSHAACLSFTCKGGVTSL